MPPKKSTKKSRESEELRLVLRKIPRWARILFICLQPLILIINLYAIYLLFKSGNQAIGAAAGFIALISDVIVLIFFYFQKSFDIFQFVKKPSSPIFILVGPIAVLIVSIFGYAIVFKTVAQHEFNKAITTRDFKEADQSLLAAETLGFAVEDNLLSEFTLALGNLDNDNALWIAKLYRENGYSVIQASANNVQKIIDAVSGKDELQAQKLAEILIQLDPAQAAKLAQEFNDYSVTARSSNPPDLTLARIYLQIVKAIDESPSVEEFRSSFERSISLFNLAQILENDEPMEAVELYRKAIRVDDNNIDAYYGLSSLLLTHYPNDPEALTEAVNVARIGVQHINGRFCRGVQDLQVKDTLHKSWSCFLLLTTESGARFERGDVPKLIMPLLEHAILLAEQNNHFGSGFFTAEPYYYLARLTEPNPSKNVLCQIIIRRNRNLPRHQEWGLYAEKLLDGKQCP